MVQMLMKLKNNSVYSIMLVRVLVRHFGLSGSSATMYGDGEERGNRGNGWTEPEEHAKQHIPTVTDYLPSILGVADTSSGSTA